MAVEAGYPDTVMCPVIGIETGRYLVVLRLVAVDAYHLFRRMHIILGSKSESSLDENAAAGRFVADHAVLHCRLADSQRRFGAAVLGYDYFSCFIFRNLPLTEIIVG